jgi:hypothetical protein
MMTGAILGITLASFMVLSQTEYTSVCRSQSWNRTIPVTEAGIEEALALLNTYAGTTNLLTSWPNAAEDDGWTALDDNVFQMTRAIGEDSYTVYITNNPSGAPTILSVATLSWNYLYAAASPPTLFAAVGVPAPSPAPPRRAVLVQVAPPKNYYLFQILAKKGITISGGGTNDSVNSADPAYAANPWASSLEHANGSIGTVETGTSSAFNESSSTILGHVYTGAGSTATTSGGNGGIGAPGWLAANPGGTEPGWVNHNLNIAVPDAPPAPTGVTLWTLPTPTNKIYTLVGSPGTTYYNVPAGLNVSGGHTILITNGPVGLICAGDFSLSGGSGIFISTGSSLVAYLNGKTSLSGQGLVNATGYATNCAFYGSPNCTSIDYSGTSGYIGTVWAPYADYTQSGGSGVIGALIINSFTQSGGRSLMRYDEALGAGPNGMVYRVASWQEVKP